MSVTGTGNGGGNGVRRGNRGDTHHPDKRWPDLEDPFLDSDQVRGALAAGADPGCPADFMEAVLGFIDSDPMRVANAVLARKGLTAGQVLDLIQPALYAEAAADLGHVRGTEPVSVNSPEAREAVVQLIARGFSVPAVAGMIGVEPERVAAFLASRRTKVTDAQLFELHVEGLNPTEMARRLPLSRTKIDERLRRLNLQPHQAKPRVSESLRNRIIGMRNNDKTYADIMEATGASESQVTSVLRTAHKKGLLHTYGKDAHRKAEAAA